MERMNKGARDVFIEALVTGDVSGAIVRQEKRGQERLSTDNDMLPRAIRNGTRELFERMGVVFHDDVDDLFVRVSLPAGWQIRARDHALWSDLADEKGRARASIFYKAAFYDRDAFMFPSRRYSYQSWPVGGYDAPGTREEQAQEGVVLDGEKVIWRTEAALPSEDTPWYDLGLSLERQAKEWLEENYPDWQNPLAYWD